MVTSVYYRAVVAVEAGAGGILPGTWTRVLRVVYSIHIQYIYIMKYSMNGTCTLEYKLPVEGKLQYHPKLFPL